MIITPLYVYRIYQIVSMFNPDDMIENIRILAVFGEGQGFLGQSIILNQALLITALWAHPRIPLWQVVIPVLACCLNAMAIMEKGTMFFVFVCIIFVLHHKKIIQLRSIIFAGLILVGFFYVFNLQRAGEDSDYSQNETITDFIAMYILSPPVALCQLMPETTPQFGTNTFGTIYHFMIRFGVNDVVEKLKTQEFVRVPILTNVYTIFQPFLIDFGYKGIAFFAALYGVICGWLYRLYKNYNSIGCCLYTFMIYVLVLQFYQENIFLSLATVTEFVILVYLMTQQYIIIRLIPHNNDDR
jgi:oligosaccharide repeat unit polymerase